MNWRWDKQGWWGSVVVGFDLLHWNVGLPEFNFGYMSWRLCSHPHVYVGITWCIGPLYLDWSR